MRVNYCRGSANCSSQEGTVCVLQHTCHHALSCVFWCGAGPFGVPRWDAAVLFQDKVSLPCAVLMYVHHRNHMKYTVGIVNFIMWYMSIYAACTAVCFYRVQRLAHPILGGPSVEAATAPISAAVERHAVSKTIAWIGCCCIGYCVCRRSGFQMLERVIMFDRFGSSVVLS